MDVIGVNQTGSIRKRQTKRGKKAAADIKVVYISSPMKVRTSASKFRALVQKLTGQDSDAERFMELIHAAAATATNTHDHGRQPSPATFVDHYLLDNDDHSDLDHHLVANEISTSSDQSSVAPPDDLFLHNFDGSFAEMFQGFLHEPSSRFGEMPGLSALL